MRIIGEYPNGNYHVLIGEDGSKIRYTKDAAMNASRPESIDMKISNRCDRGCAFCHENSVPDGALANLHHPILDTIPSYTELALGGGDIYEHPDLIPFLKRMRANNVFCNVTLHLDHFTKYYYKVTKHLVEDRLIRGVGISVNESITDEQLKQITSIPTAVVHCIAGVITPELLMQMGNRGLKLLILGYKDFRRGHLYGIQHEEQIKNNIAAMQQLMPQLKTMYKVISFDNLALKQLYIRNLVSKEEWESNYMGDDGHYTMYIDLVKEEYAISSVSPRHPIVDETVTELFTKVKEECNA